MLELNFGLQRTLNGHNGTEILTQKTADMSPHIKIRVIILIKFYM